MTFEEYLEQTNAAGGLQTEDVLTAFLPLARLISQWHEEGRVAPPLDWEALEIREDGALALRSPVSAEPSINRGAVEALQRPVVTGLQVVGHGRVTSDDDEGTSYQSLDVVEPGATINRPVYFVGYGAWEQAVGHHDALVDVFSLGMLLAALALGLDFNERTEVERFVRSRDNLFGLNERLHPVLAAAIREMTVLDRHQRTGNLRSLIRRLETYRDQPVELSVSKLPGFASATPRDRRTLIKTHLRDRLFEVSRRNRLVYFKPTQSSVNLTVASVPLVIQLSSIRREHLFVASGDVLTQLSECKAINLGKHLRFEDQPYLAGALDRLISEARRHRAEYGFAQLRLVLAFLHWHNLKEAPAERIVSPLLLLPVELTRKKGVKDHYVIEPTSSEAEVNPALRHHLKQLYDLDLPETLDLATTPLTAFHGELQRQIRATEPAVTLRLADEPQIELIHERARQRLAQFKRRQPRGPGGGLAPKPFDYSYQAEGFKPLGLQLFREKVEHAPLPQRGAAGGVVSPRAPRMVPDTLLRKQETENQTFALREQREGNPYLWDFDLCSVTLGNFNYRKMSLVRDYGALIAEQVSSPAFDCVFPIEPRSIDSEPPAALDLAAEWPVVDSDATQRAAVALARTGRSFIVQGPPGTGKSQTITNLIADYVARGKRVLFVCEKRAAIDVVFHRLRQQGLDELCCLIHDSQTDKKAFVQNLKQTYETWIAQPDGADRALADRNAVLKRIQQDLDQLQRFDAAMSSVPEHIGGTVRDLLQTLVALREQEPKLTARAAERLPEYSIWRAHTDLAHRLGETLKELCSTDCLARHPFRTLSAELIESDRPLETLHEWADRIESAIDAIESALTESALPTEHWDTLEEVEQLAAFGALLTGVVDRGQLSLLNEQSDLSRSLKQAADQAEVLQQALARAENANARWREKLSPDDVEAALGLAQSKERSIFRFFSSQWRHLKRTLEARYDFSANAFRPTFTQILKQLKAEYAARDRLTEARAAAAAAFGTDLQALVATMTEVKALCEKPAVRQLRDTLLSSPKAAEIVRQLAALAPKMRELLAMLPRLLREGFVRIRVAELGELMRDLRDNADVLPDVLPLLTELEGSHEQFAAAIRHYELNADALTAACARQSLEHLYRTQRWLPRFDGRTVERCAVRISEAQQQWRTQNAAVIRSNLRQLFRQHVQLAMTSATQLDAEQKVFKKSYSTGRRELEHEFGKSMRFKSIRDLATGESGGVIRDLKPIWLMSPLSVSDTLPLETELFDAVVFDEASQIPVEEAVPALYRAPQVIIVGDEMQLPPTNFFSTRTDATDEIEVEEDDERVAISLDADSLLTQSARNLPATLLAWHYRSRSESLIGFSNAAFYAGNLFTIPDRAPAVLESSGPAARGGSDASSNVDLLLSRPLTFHYMEASPYENRRNQGEAAYVAGLVRGLLQRGSPLSIGVVAFSEAQQTEIESALDALSEEDADFAALLESAYVREEHDQFCGLFVKNLENVQGDERDVIILSICYGPDAQGHMLMNFGPINQRGGEKRLNVIFSRAKHHMAVVSSIRHNAITNDYNDGAAALKGFLQYAEFASLGDARSARAVLEGLNPLTRKAIQRQAASDTVLEQLARALRARGHVVDESVGQSRFRCDLAVRSGDRREYRLGLFIDTEDYYSNGSVEERHVTRPGILRAFGWQVMTVLARDWYHEPEGVLDRIERRLRGEEEPVVEDELPALPPVVESGRNAEAAARAGAQPGDAQPQPAGAQLTGTQLRSATAPEQSDTVVKRCEFVEGSSSKFWQVSRTGTVLTIQFGRIGTHGQAMTKSFDTVQRATNELEKLFGEKLRKGYKVVSP